MSWTNDPQEEESDEELYIPDQPKDLPKFTWDDVFAEDTKEEESEAEMKNDVEALLRKSKLINRWTIEKASNTSTVHFQLLSQVFNQKVPNTRKYVASSDPTKLTDATFKKAVTSLDYWAIQFCHKNKNKYFLLPAGERVVLINYNGDYTNGYKRANDKVRKLIWAHMGKLDLVQNHGFGSNVEAYKFTKTFPTLDQLKNMGKEFRLFSSQPSPFILLAPWAKRQFDGCCFGQGDSAIKTYQTVFCNDLHWKKSTDFKEFGDRSVLHRPTSAIPESIWKTS